MRKGKFADLANYDSKCVGDNRNKLLAKALDNLAELLGIEFGSLTIHFHKGRWSPRIEIQKNVVREIDR